MSPSPVAAAVAASPLGPEDYEQLDAWLDEARERHPHTPQWEFCEGFLAALVCCRSAIAPADYWPELFDTDASPDELFGTPERRAAFEQLWARRWQEVAASLQADVEDLQDERAYCPQVTDVRSALAALPPAERAEALDLAPDADIDAALAELPWFGQVWALGFLQVVQSWPWEWQAPSRDKPAARALDEALATLATLAEDDAGPPEVAAYETADGQDGPPSMSVARLEGFGEAIWAVYDLHAIGRALGPRVEPVRRAGQPGRNDPCPCGSGRKFKKCHGGTA
ncbi:UPF0149 family protein [Pseudorhodoferax sp.]|uniref:YecA/YgfB family protein n=1 Tax=Pseudorhodoferax sp. TaxID=1993553 RepID=UPI0039E33C68